MKDLDTFLLFHNFFFLLLKIKKSKDIKKGTQQRGAGEEKKRNAIFIINSLW